MTQYSQTRTMLQTTSALARIVYVILALWCTPQAYGQHMIKTTTPTVRSVPSTQVPMKKSPPLYDRNKRSNIFPPDLEQDRVQSLPLPEDSVFKKIRFFAIDTCLRALGKKSFRSVEDLTYTVIAPARNDYEKVWAIFRWMNLNLTYDKKVYDDCEYEAEVEPSKVLRTRTTVCGGYARMFDEMCFYAGVQSRIVRGTTSCPMRYKPLSVGGLERVSHVWNHVILDGRRYFCDPTWGVRMARYEGTDSIVPVSYSSYFLRDPELVSDIHHYKNIEDYLQAKPLHHADRMLRFVPYGAGIALDFKVQMEERSYFQSKETIPIDILAPYKNDLGSIDYYILVYNHSTDKVVDMVSATQKMFRQSFKVHFPEQGLYSLSLYRFVKERNRYSTDTNAMIAPEEFIAQKVVVVGDTIPHVKSQYHCNRQLQSNIQLLGHADSTMIIADSVITLQFTTRPHYTYNISFSNNLQIELLDAIKEEVKDGIFTVTLRAPTLGEYTCTVYGYDTLALARQQKQRRKTPIKNAEWHPVADVGISFRKAPSTLTRSYKAMLIAPQTEWLEHGKEVTIRFLMPDSCINVRWVQNRDNPKKCEKQVISVHNNIATITTTPNLAKGDKVWFEYEYYHPVYQRMEQGAYYFHVGKRKASMQAIQQHRPQTSYANK